MNEVMLFIKGIPKMICPLISKALTKVPARLFLSLRRNRGKRYFSLVEAMFAVAVASIGLAAASSLVSFNLKASYYVNARMTAVAIARNRIELIRTAAFADLPLYQENQVQVNYYGFPDPAGRYYRSSSIGTLVNSTRQIDITVTSTGVFQGQNISIPLTTIVMDKSLLVIGK